MVIKFWFIKESILTFICIKWYKTGHDVGSGSSKQD
jgi:hypothetical protein